MYRGGLYRELMLATGSRKILVAVRKIKKACYLNKTHQNIGHVKEVCIQCWQVKPLMCIKTS